MRCYMGRKWSCDEINYLKSNFATLDNNEIARTLSRTTSSILSMSGKLKLKKQYKEKITVKYNRLYKIYNNLKNRCDNKNSDRYNDYGGRGIKYCEEWNSFNIFLQWALSNGYKEHLTIDRIDNYGNYCPENCRWITKAEQNRNTRQNIKITAFNETKTLAEWSVDPRCTVKYRTIVHRYHSGKYSSENILTSETNARELKLYAFSELKNLTEWAKDRRCVIKYGTLYKRFKDGKMTAEEMLTTPLKGHKNDM